MSHSSLKRRAVLLAACTTALVALAPATALAAEAGFSTCGVLASGKINCWGANSSGQLGNNSNSSSSVPVEVQGITTAKQVSSGAGQACATLASGKVNCWGNNSDGTLGTTVPGKTVCGFFFYSDCVFYYDLYESDVPVEVGTITDAKQVAVGLYHACAALASGKVNCWGDGSYGGLGNDGATAGGSVPVEVKGITTAEQVSVGMRRACAVLSSGKVNCWGEGSLGTNGDGSIRDRSAPVEVTGITNAKQVSEGDNHVCAALRSGKVNCWGANSGWISGVWTVTGQLGNNSTDSTSNVPVEVQGITTATQVASGMNFSCARLSSGKVNCWGQNDYGQLGNDSTAGSSVPVEVQGITTATQIDAGRSHACALLASGAVKCWGYNVLGQLGNNSTTDSKVPVGVSNVSTFVTFESLLVAAPPADTTAPVAPGSFTGVPSDPTVSASATLGFTLGESGGTVECRLDSDSWGPCTSVSGTSGSFEVSGLSVGSHTVSVRQTDAAGNVGVAGTASWTVRAPVAAPIPAPTVLTPASGTKTVYKSGGTWHAKTGLLFSNGGDSRGGAQLLTVQFAVDGAGRPVSATPSDTQPLPTAATFSQGVVAWDTSGEVSRATAGAPVWVRVGNRVGKWSGWVKLTQ